MPQTRVPAHNAVVRHDAIECVSRRLAASRRTVILTGAGVSAASGVPTFRGAGGLWKRFRVEALATPEAFDRDPRLVWEWYDWRRQRVASCVPNRAHGVIAAWTMRLADCHVITQNVDDLHVRAGTQNLLRLHGSLWEMSCRARCAASPRTWRDETVPLPALPHPCPSCGGLARPAVVWFGEPLDPDVVARASALASCDVFLTVGTSAVVYPAASFVYAAKRAGAFTVEVNIEPTPASDEVDVALHGPAEDVIEQVDRLLREG